MTLARRDVLKATAAAGTVGIPAAAHAAYDPAAKFELIVTEVELRKNTAGRMLMARIYLPPKPGKGGAGSFPDRARPARRCLEQEGPLRRGADGPRAGG